MSTSLSIEQLKAFGKNGSWPYFPGNEPSTESTVVCAIACRAEDSVCQGALNYLLSIRNPDGGWSSGQSLGDSDWNTGLALFGIIRLSEELKSRKKLSSDLEEKCSQIYKTSLEKLASLRADTLSDLSSTVLTAVSGPDFDYPRGWPWEENTWHWVEPTAYSLLAIKAGPMSREKPYASAVEQAHSYLYEKTCKGGGWNWGQTSTLGFDFSATARDTALALLALQDEKDNAKVQSALAILRAVKPDGKKGYIEPLVLIARDAYGDDVSADVAMLTKNYKAPEYGGENLVSLAYAAMAAEIAQHGNGFKLNASAPAGRTGA